MGLFIANEVREPERVNGRHGVAPGFPKEYSCEHFVNKPTEGLPETNKVDGLQTKGFPAKRQLRLPM